MAGRDHVQEKCIDIHFLFRTRAGGMLKSVLSRSFTLLWKTMIRVRSAEGCVHESVTSFDEADRLF